MPFARLKLSFVFFIFGSITSSLSSFTLSTSPLLVSHRTNLWALVPRSPPQQYTHSSRKRKIGGSSREESLSLNIIDYLFYFRFLRKRRRGERERGEMPGFNLPWEKAPCRSVCVAKKRERKPDSEEIEDVSLMCMKSDGEEEWKLCNNIATSNIWQV